ncbi:uncharacterized protein KY384_003649 [Bacidia gigantensis]|uniref:uncharacterized protein n=1 Tax=Bacidia gigantensis TaxID=2732470 RepID=UPI001D05BC40|nr:uncharacterized protein KY384_003649 [Bacidia gigantensis]KAG8532013.1 hypothetical protein KY384_003649 [Bacidia gigantensis]
MSKTKLLYCPFCNFVESDPNFLQQHVNLIHPEDDDAPYLVHDPPAPRCQSLSRATTALEGASDWVACDCGEVVLLIEYNAHLDLHEEENAYFDGISTRAELANDTMADSHTMSSPRGASFRSSFPLSKPLHNPTNQYSSSQYPEIVKYGEPSFLGRQKSCNPPKAGQSSIMGPLKTSTANIARLGAAELGPYYNEVQMPPRLRQLLEKGAKMTITNQITRDGRLLRIENVANEMRGIVPVLAKLCAQDALVTRAYLCHPDVTNIFKMSKEGGFCGFVAFPLGLIPLAYGEKLSKHSNDDVLHPEDTV